MSNLGHSASQHGYSLLELTIVVVLLGMVAAYAIPSISSGDSSRLQLATSEVADAFRFAREEARRTGVVHGVAAEVANNRIRVFRVDESATPNNAVYDVRHPTTKGLYQLDLSAPRYRGAALTAVNGTPTGVCGNPAEIAIDGAGTVRCVEPLSTRINSPSVVLNANGQQASITLDTYTARVGTQ